MTYLRESLEAHVYAQWSILAKADGIYFSPRTAADALFDLLLELQALDILGVADLIRDEETRAVQARRRQNKRKSGVKLERHPR